MPENEIKIINREIISPNDNLIQRTENLLNQINETGHLMFNTIERISQTIERVKELDYEIKQIEYNFLLKAKEYDFRIEKIKENKEIIQSVLNKSSNVVDKILDAVLAMDEHNDDPAFIKKREDLLQQLRISSDNLSLMFISFLKS